MSGFSGSDSYSLITSSLNYIITDFRYQEQAQRQSEYFKIISGKGNLFKADIFAEMLAVSGYNGFLRVVPFDADTVKLIRGIIADEEVHINNWKKAEESLVKRKSSNA